MKRNATAAERRYMAAVAAMGCIVCSRLGFEGTPAQVHHQIRGRGGWGRSSHFNTIPVCPHHHHMSGEGIHDMGEEQYLAHFGFSEADLVDEVRGKLSRLLPPSETIH